ncbi:MAG TPA: SIS domain-containing protein [Candidatus Limnocylindria bacterium]
MTDAPSLSQPAARFLAAASNGLAALAEREGEHLAQASAWMGEAIAAGGLVRIFGTGHSRLLAEEIFFRAGGLAPTDAILEDAVSGYHDVSKSELTERLEGLGEIIVAHRRLAPPDVLIIVSQSGRNAVPIEVADAARARGVRTIGITSIAHASGQPSRHSSGRHLHDAVDLVIDNGAPAGDCAVQLANGVPVGPLSGVLGAAVVQMLVVGAADWLLANGVEPPVFRSGNVDGGREESQKLLDRYWDRVRGW